MKFIVFTLPFAIALAITSPAQVPPIGQWREHLNYQHTIQVLMGDKLYCATGTNVFSIDAGNEVLRYSKVTGLNDIGVSCIGWDAASKQVVIAYTNSNLDILKDGNATNIGDIRRSTIAGNKTIYSIYCKNGYAYLCSGLGIIVANLSKYEIKDTWFIGNNGNQVKVNAVTSDASFLYAATDEGLKKAASTATDLSNYANWSTISGTNGLPAGACSNVAVINNTIIAQKKDSLFVANGNNWSLLYTDPAWAILSVTASENKLLVCQHSNAGNARVVQLSPTGAIEKNLAQQGIIVVPLAAINVNGAAWIADQVGGLSKFTTSFERFIPNGPPGIADGDLITSGNMLSAAAGSVDENWHALHNRNGIFQLIDNVWSSRNFQNLSLSDSVADFITLAPDPADAGIWAGSYGGGLVNFKAGAATVYNNQNSTLQSAIGDPGSYRVSGLAFDKNNNLWISNYGAAQNLQVRKADGKWKAFTIPFSHFENAVSQVIVDDNNQLWILSPKGNGVFCYNYGQQIDNTNDDQWKYYRQGSGQGNLPSNTVRCLMKDRDGFIWVGTDRGIGIIQCASDVFSAQSCDAVLPVVQQDRFAGLLFRNETVQCMAADGANRKWIGTRNGVWLLSPDGTKIIYRFTAENSPLLANDVKRMAVDPLTGEVFMATVNGICSFRSTATEGGETNSNVLVFPNPVPPGYHGTIAIRGLVTNALVKITEMNGRLVHQTRALGGQAIWDGRNYKGEKVASGIYLVMVRDDSGNEKMVTKIVTISGK